MYADVAVCLPLSRTFVYKADDALEVGCRVIVPFRNREVDGFVVALRDEAPGIEVHSIKAIVDNTPLLQPQIFELCRWISDYYVSPIGEVLKAALPPGITAKHVENHSPPRRGGGAPRSASPTGRSLDEGASASLGASTPPLRGGECLVLTPDQTTAL